jgi:hypothetical protein
VNEIIISGGLLRSRTGRGLIHDLLEKGLHIRKAKKGETAMKGMKLSALRMQHHAEASLIRDVTKFPLTIDMQRQIQMLDRVRKVPVAAVPSNGKLVKGS